MERAGHSSQVQLLSSMNVRSGWQQLAGNLARPDRRSQAAEERSDGMPLTQTPMGCQCPLCAEPDLPPKARYGAGERRVSRYLLTREPSA